MKKYTVYEIEKLTNGKLTKYKLNQAIETGLLIADKVGGSRRGRGVPKYVIEENDLQVYLNHLESNKKKTLILPEDNESVMMPQNSSVHALIEEKEKLIREQQSFLNELGQQIQMLKLNPNKENHEDRNETKSTERRKLILELANMGVFSFKRKKEILDRLNHLA